MSNSATNLAAEKKQRAATASSLRVIIYVLIPENTRNAIYKVTEFKNENDELIMDFKETISPATWGRLSSTEAVSKLQRTQQNVEKIDPKTGQVTYLTYSRVNIYP